MKIRSVMSPPPPSLALPDGCAPDITETNYVNIGYVVRGPIRQFSPPHDIQFFLFLKLDITVAIRDRSSIFP